MSITLIIIIATVIVSFSCFNNQELFSKLQYSPYLVLRKKQWFRLFSHALVHADWSHLFVNMYVLYMFGDNIENIYSQVFEEKGVFYFILLYVGGIVFAALPALKKHGENYYYNAVGASGSVSALVFAFILFMPTTPMGILFIPVRVPAFIFGGLYLAMEYYLNKKSQDNIAHDAHYWGALFGVVFTIILEPKVGISFINQILNYLS